MFNTHFEKIYSIESDLIKNRLCLFYGLFLDEIFIEDSNKFILCFEFLLKAVLDYNINQGTSHIVFL